MGLIYINKPLFEEPPLRHYHLHSQFAAEGRTVSHLHKADTEIRPPLGIVGKKIRAWH